MFRKAVRRLANQRLRELQLAVAGGSTSRLQAAVQELLAGLATACEAVDAYRRVREWTLAALCKRQWLPSSP